MDGSLVGFSMIWRHPTEATVKKWMFQIPGCKHENFQDSDFYLVPETSTN